MPFGAFITSSYLGRYLWLNAPNLTDYQHFPTRSIQNAPPTFNFATTSVQSTILQQAITYANGGQVHSEGLEPFLQRTGTVAFIIVQNNSVQLERYFAGYAHQSVVSSFSIAKSVVSALIGIALGEGYLHSLDDPLTRYLPQLKANYWSAITLRHLVSMASGLQYRQGAFFPWSDEPRVYYTTALRQLATQARPLEKPGQRFHYNNYNLVLLGMVLEQATGSHVATYLQEKLWKQIGMEAPATWSLDSERSGMEKMESGLNAWAIDFAKFGRLYLRHGEWNGKQVIPEAWVHESTSIAVDAKWKNYKYLWWIPSKVPGRYMAIGNLGQFMYVAPDKNLLILRFGARGGMKGWQYTFPQIFGQLAERF